MKKNLPLNKSEIKRAMEIGGISLEDIMESPAIPSFVKATNYTSTKNKTSNNKKGWAKNL